MYDDELDCKYNIMMEIWIDAYNRNSLLMDNGHDDDDEENDDNDDYDDIMT